MKDATRYLILALVLVAALALLGCEKQQATTTTPAPKETTVTQPPAEKPVAPETKAPESDAVAAARKLGTPTTNPVVKTPSGLEYIDVKVGEGAAAKAGQMVSVHYTGWLVSGSKFDSSVDRGQPFSFGLGAGQVIKGWDEGVAGMQPGGVRKLIVPPTLGYGPRAIGPIPPNSTLIFEVQFLSAK
jgi:FKBP-type peptidyl-prolyl cis-trans isomerase